MMIYDRKPEGALICFGVGLALLNIAWRSENLFRYDRDLPVFPEYAVEDASPTPQVYDEENPRPTVHLRNTFLPPPKTSSHSSASQEQNTSHLTVTKRG